MVGYDDESNALTLGDDDSLKVGDYDLEYNSTDDEWQARFGRAIGGEAGYHAEVLGPTYSNDSEVGERSLFFESGDYVEVSIEESSPIRTFACWVKTARDYDGGGDVPRSGLLLPDSGESVGISIGDWTGDISNESVVIANDGTDLNYTTQTINADTWTHIAAVYDGTDYDIYINGSEASTQSLNNGAPLIQVDTFLWNIGSRSHGTDSPMSGNIDDFRLYSRSLSASEINDLSNGVDVTGDQIVRYSFDYDDSPKVAVDVLGDVYPKNSIPRSTSGSLVPQGLAESVSAGEVLADDGNTYTSVQTAINNSSGWVFIGPGTFNENVDISTEGLTVEGSGYDTLIDGGTSSALDISASYLTLRGFSVQTNSGSTANAVNTTANGIVGGTLDSIVVRQAGDNGVVLSNSTEPVDMVVKNCEVYDVSGNGLNITALRTVVTDCIIENAGTDGIVLFRDDSIAVNNIVRGCGADGIVASNNDQLIGGNRVTNSTDVGMQIDNDTNNCVIYNNRISDSGTSDINDAGTGTVTDGNLTGVSN